MYELIFFILILIITIIIFATLSEYLVNFLYDNKDLKDETDRLVEKLKIVTDRNKELRSIYLIKRDEALKVKQWEEILQQRDDDIKKQREEEKLKEERRISKLNECIKNYRNKKLNRSSEELGARYERQIGYIYEQQGDRVEYNGIYYGKKDKGIDLIIKKKNVHYVIQCKNYSSTHEIHLNTIDQFNSVINRYKRENKGQKVYGILCTSNDNLDADAKKELEILDITHNVEPYSVNYPLVKCKKESMIYHLPCNANYDRIKINIKKGDIYLETPQEAIDKGFRPANN